MNTFKVIIGRVDSNSTGTINGAKQLSRINLQEQLVQIFENKRE